MRILCPFVVTWLFEDLYVIVTRTYRQVILVRTVCQRHLVSMMLLVTDFRHRVRKSYQAQSRDDGYSSNRTPPEDYSPEMEEILAAVDAVHFEPEPLISTFDVVFEPANQEQ